MQGQRFPLVIFSNGFATEASQYSRLAEALAAGGCAVLRYDVPGAGGATDDTLVSVLRSLVDYASTAPELAGFVAAGHIVLAGHSRGAKIASLAAAVDDRVAGLCLLDPVDNTKWAPLGPGFPSACDALRNLSVEGSPRTLPVAVVGAGFGGDCAPGNANYRRFFEAAGRPAWLLVVPAAGHAQFTDPTGVGAVQRVLCSGGGAEDRAVQEAAAAACLAWVGATCGPLLPVDLEEDVGDEPSPLEELAARTEIARRVHQLSPQNEGPQAQEVAISAGVAAAVASDWLRRRGIEVESFVNL